MEIGILGRDGELHRCARLAAGVAYEVDDVVVDDDGGHHDAGAALAFRIGHQARVHVEVTFDFANALGLDLRNEFLDDCKWIAWKGRTVIRVVVVDKSESAVGLDAIGKIGIAAGDEDEVALECAVLVDWSGAVDAGMETVISAELREESAFRERFRGRGGDEQFVSVQRINDFAGVERVELDAEIGMSKFGAARDFLYPLSKNGFRLRTGGRGRKA